MPISRWRHCWPYLGALCALAACSASSTPAQQSLLCHDGIDNTIQVSLDAFPQALPVDVRACIQTSPCQTGHTTGKSGVNFKYTLDDHHQKITVPVSLTVTSNGRTLASGKIDVAITQDYMTDAATQKTANCGGGALITVSATGQLKAERLL
ncbi:MAG: hypothetical protein JO079_04965 [Frankiaceae bacterium]|nr:hypothetical protein [Frankiaceae bacterium]MBV9368302.1 hypothetical protein [Frankiales bacterium]